MPEPRKVERITNRLDETEFRPITKQPTFVRSVRTRIKPKIVGMETGIEVGRRKTVRRKQ